MRSRWRAVSELWEAHKGANNRLDLLQHLDYMRKLSSQFGSTADTRVLYAKSGRPTAAVLTDPDLLVENSLYSVACETVREAHFLAAVINSRTLENAVQRFMPKGQFGARDLHRHLWRLPIPT
ncbi:MAG: hypothetical protein F4089_14600, partial [Gammaproteobacteria bacterium]|nr:hypothetical protein [Gammaproteobacteria bacterium]